MTIHFDIDRAYGEMPVDAETWDGRTMLVVWTDRVPAPGDEVIVTLSLTPLAGLIPTKGSRIGTYIGVPQMLPGRHVWTDPFTEEMVADAKRNGAICVRVETGAKPRALIFAMIPGTAGDIPEWGDTDAREQLRDLLADLKPN